MNSFYRFSPFLGKLLIVLLMLAAYSSCEISSFTEEVDASDANPEPSITGSISFFTLDEDENEVPLSMDTVAVFRDFSIRVTEISDNTPGLSAAFFEVLDTAENVVFEDFLRLQGTESNVTFTASAGSVPSNASYTLRVRIQDLTGAESQIAQSFFGRGPLSVNDNMFLLGTFNDFGGTDRQMTLVEDFIWQFEGSIDGSDAFKFVNTPDFSDSDWGDADCDNQAEPGTLDNNIACGFSGDVVFTFNDLTLEYSVLATDGSFNSVFEDVFIIGNFTGWGNDNADLSVSMDLVDNNTWQAVVDANTPIEGAFNPESDDATFKFFGGPNFEPEPDLGDNEPDFIADGFGANIVAGPAGEYTITLNDISLEYSARLNVESNFDQIFIIGNFTGWGNDNSDLSIPMQLVGDNMWEADVDASMDVDGAFNSASDNIIFKFFGGPNFEGNPDFGDNEQDGIVETNGGNIDPGESAGNYVIRLNDETREYSVEAQ